MSNPELGFIPILSRLAERIGSDADVIDVGAFRGMMTEEMRKIFTESRFHLFEPLPNWAETLTQRYIRNDRIGVHRKAVSDCVGTAEFHVGSFEPTSSLFPRNVSGARYFDPAYDMAETVTVETVTLDAFCDGEGIDHVACLKMDTQGAEKRIIDGAHDLLGRGAVDIIITEWFGVPHYEGAPQFNHIWSALDWHGYTMLNIFPGPTAPNGQLRYGDAIFVSSKVRQNALSEAN